MTSSAIAPARPLTWQHIAILLAGRLTLNTAFRIVYPLLTFLALGLEVDLRVASLLVTMQVGATMLSPVGGMVADAHGDRAAMLWGLGFFCAGAALCTAARDFAPFLVGYGLIGLGTAFYHPAAQAYASARTAYARRGQVLGLLELGWALSALVGVAGLSRLVEASSDWAPAFAVLLGAGGLILALTLVGLPAAPAGAPRPAGGRWLNLAVLKRRSVAAALAFLFCALLAYELLIVVYAGWMEAAFGATTAQIGIVFGILGFAELGGVLAVTLLVDRIGKRRATLLGFTATGLLQMLLPLSAGNWTLFVPLILLFSLCFEFALVSAFPLLSGLDPTARGAVLAFSVTAIGIGRVIGSLVGTPLWQTYGFLANGLLGCGLTLLGVLICLLFVREGET